MLNKDDEKTLNELLTRNPDVGWALFRAMLAYAIGKKIAEWLVWGWIVMLVLGVLGNSTDPGPSYWYSVGLYIFADLIWYIVGRIWQGFKAWGANP